MRRVVGFGLAGFMALVVAGVSVSLASTQDSAPLLPDVIEEVPSHLQVQNTQQREWLRFTTVHVSPHQHRRRGTSRSAAAAHAIAP